MKCKECGAKINKETEKCPKCNAILDNKTETKKKIRTTEEKKKLKIMFIIYSLVIVAVLGVGLYFLFATPEEPPVPSAFDTSAYAKQQKEENAFQYSDSVVEINSKVFASDSEKITVRNVGKNDETTLIKGHFEPGIVTDGKTVYYFDLDSKSIKSLNVKTKKSKEIIKVEDHIKPDEKSSSPEYTFARFDGMYKDYLYYQVQEGEEYMPNYMVNVKTGKVKKLALAEYGTYKLQIAGGKLYFDIFRTVNAPTVLYTANPDGSNVEVLVEGVSNFEVIGEKLYYFKVNMEDMLARKNTHKIMCYDIKEKKHKVIKENMEYVHGGFTSYGMVYDKTLGGSVNAVIEYYDGGGEALNGNGVKTCGDVAIIHAGIPEDISSDKAMEQAKVPEWYVVGNKACSKLITLPENTTPVNFKDGYIYYHTYQEDGCVIINRTKVEY